MSRQRLLGLGLISVDRDVSGGIDDEFVALLKPGEETVDEAGRPVRDHLAGAG